MDTNNLNLLIETKVLGSTPWLQHRGEYEYIVWQKAGDREPWYVAQNWQEARKRYDPITLEEIDYHKHIVIDPPKYSTDIAAAWKIVEKVKTWEAIDRQLFQQELQVWASRRCGLTFDLIAPIEIIIHLQPEDICLAALNAVGVAIPEDK